jgi:hypothetical protein
VRAAVVELQLDDLVARAIVHPQQRSQHHLATRAATLGAFAPPVMNRADDRYADSAEIVAPATMVWSRETAVLDDALDVFTAIRGPVVHGRKAVTVPRAA